MTSNPSTPDFSGYQELKDPHLHYAQIYICSGCGDMNLSCPSCGRMMMVTKSAIIDYLRKLQEWRKVKGV